MASPAAVIVLAAGGSTRMKSKTVKVLHPLAGRSIVGHVLAAVRGLQPERLVAVVGFGQDQVVPHVRELAPEALFAVQETQLGTGHAVGVAMAELARAGEPRGTVLVVNGDAPLVRAESLWQLIEGHEQGGNAVTVLTGHVPNPLGYGRIVRSEGGEVAAIVEEKDAGEELRRITEVNSGVYAFDARYLSAAIGRIGNDNASGEYYLTDVVALAVRDGHKVGAHLSTDVLDLEGVNTRAQLASLGRQLNDRILGHWMAEGVTVTDPASTWIDVDVTLARDVTLLPGVQLLGATTVAEDAVIGPDSTLKDVEVGIGARVVRSHAQLAVIGAGADVGPFAHLRPGTEIAAHGKVGGFVETKNAKIGEGAKVPHLSYVGDAEIGEGSNIGAGTIFANYDGVDKHHTTIGKHVHVGSNNTLIAPVEVGDGATTGGGATIRADVPPGALAISAGPQRNIEGWVAKKQASGGESA